MIFRDTIRRSRGSVERIGLLVTRLFLEISPLEDGGRCCRLSPHFIDLLFSNFGNNFVLHGLSPLRCQGNVTTLGLGEAFFVILEPEIKLEVFGGVFNIDEVIHEVADSQGLQQTLETHT